MDLTTSARVEAHLKAGGRPLGGKYATFIASAITAYSALAEKRMNRKVQAQAQTEFFDVRIGDRQRFLLRGVPVSSITSVHSDADREYGATALLASTDYTFRPNSGLLIVDGVTLAAGANALKVVYVGGMAADVDSFVTAFPDLAHAIETQIVHHMQRIDALGKSSQSVAGGGVSWTGALDLLPILRKELRRHRM